MKISKLARREAKALFRTCEVDGRLDESRVREAVRVMTEQKPRSWLPILSHFQRLVKLEVDRCTAHVESAAALDAGQQADLKARVERLYGAGLTFQFQENPALLGGLRVRVGSDVYDGSIESRLVALEQSF